MRYAQVKKLFFVTNILILLLAQSSCSLRFYYVIVNASAHPLLVEYRFKEFPYAEARDKNINPQERHFYHPPAMISLEDLKDQTGEWKNVLVTNFTVNDEMGELKITVPARKVLKIYDDNEYTLDEKSNSFPIAMVSLTGDAGRILVEGKMLRTQFVKFSGTTYQIRYQ